MKLVTLLIIVIAVVTYTIATHIISFMDSIKPNKVIATVQYTNPIGPTQEPPYLLPSEVIHTNDR